MKKYFLLLIFSAFLVGCSKSNGPKPDDPDTPFVPDVNIGAYYFGGWYENSHHV